MKEKNNKWKEMWSGKSMSYNNRYRKDSWEIFQYDKILK